MIEIIRERKKKKRWIQADINNLQGANKNMKVGLRHESTMATGAAILATCQERDTHFLEAELVPCIVGKCSASN